MSTSPNLPTNLPSKSWTDKPDGKAGAVLLGAGGLVAAWYLFPMAILLLTDAIHIGILLGTIIGVSWLLFTDNQIRRTFMIAYKLVMRKLVGCMIELDPIGIVRNIITQMKAQLSEMDLMLGQLKGVLTDLTTRIFKNKAESDKSMKLAAKAKSFLETEKDPLEKLKWQGEMTTNSNHGTRLSDTNVRLNLLATKIQQMYDIEIRWRTAADYYIQDKESLVDDQEQERKAVNKAYGVYQRAMRLFANNDQNELFDRTMDFMAEDAASKLGQMQDFQRIASTFVSKMDLEQGVVSDDAMKALEQYQSSLLVPTNSTEMPSVVTTPTPAAMAATASGTVDNNPYKDLLS